VFLRHRLEVLVSASRSRCIKRGIPGGAKRTGANYSMLLHERNPSSAVGGCWDTVSTGEQLVSWPFESQVGDDWHCNMKRRYGLLDHLMRRLLWIDDCLVNFMILAMAGLLAVVPAKLIACFTLRQGVGGCSTRQPIVQSVLAWVQNLAIDTKQDVRSSTQDQPRTQDPGPARVSPSSLMMWRPVYTRNWFFGLHQEELPL
jgi:hypothetical protein